MDSTALAQAVARLSLFRAAQSEEGSIDDLSSLTAGDIDMILARLHETMGVPGWQDMQLADEGGSEDRTTQWYKAPESLTDHHVLGEHGAMQDGVDDDRKDALADEIDRRGLGD